MSLVVRIFVIFLVAKEEGGGRIRCFEVSEGMSTCWIVDL